MIRHPLLRAAQSVAASAAIALVAVRPAPATNVRFSLAAMGERERPDGSWEGVDLLRGRAEPIDRFQLTLTPETDARAQVEAQAADGSWEPLYEGTLAGHRGYALPAPHARSRKPAGWERIGRPIAPRIGNARARPTCRCARHRCRRKAPHLAGRGPPAAGRLRVATANAEGFVKRVKRLALPAQLKSE